MSRGIVTACFNNRVAELDGLICNIRKFTDLPISVLCDFPDFYKSLRYGNDNVKFLKVEPMWIGHPRYGNRNKNFYQIYGLTLVNYSSILFLDDDMRIVDSRVFEGFELADRFNLCLPINPRCFVGVDAKIGSDVPANERNAELYSATAWNCAIMFVNKINWGKSGVKEFIDIYCEISKQTPMRMPMLLWKTIERTGFVPYPLPYPWCVCLEDINNMHQKPIVLHCGHQVVKEYHERLV